MPLNKYANRIERHAIRQALLGICRVYKENHDVSQDELFPDLGRKAPKPRTPESGLLDFPAIYDTTPAIAAQPIGPLTHDSPPCDNTNEES